MANARELLKRKKTTQNTRKITRTMELVASAKMKKAQDAAESSRPYAEGLAELVGRLAGGDGELSIVACAAPSTPTWSSWPLIPSPPIRVVAPR
ncbi:MAG: F0F1 ATP synthase subunit gamma [Planctomycetota bacterium]|jgi:ATP synthase F1 gamma subunit